MGMHVGPGFGHNGVSGKRGGFNVDAKSYDRSLEDVGNILQLEHVNVTVPDQQLAHLFYVTGMGLTRDPYVDFGDRNMWINVGRQQFHMPLNDPQVLRGTVGLVLPDLEGLKVRLDRIGRRFKDSKLNYTEGNGHVDVTCPWGNHIRCHPPGEAFGNMEIGMPYVEFTVKPRSAGGIAEFYQKVLQAPSKVVKDDDGTVAVVSIGNDQTLRYRETTDEIPDYDGHHLAIYVANFSNAHDYLSERELVFEESDAHQYRFRDIPHPKSGKVLFTVEHEVRSLGHPMWGRDLLNRNPEQGFFTYRRGHDRLPV